MPPDSSPLQRCRRRVLKSDLENVSLVGADFRCADLSGLEFPAVDVTGADFSGANLCDADLSKVRHLSWWQLGATNLERAVLPRRFTLEGIPTVQALAGRAEKLLLGILAACATTLILTLLTSHVQFFTPASAIDLPFLSVPVPIRAFYFVAPWLLLLTYCYLLATLLKLWSVLRETPRMLRHGKPVYEVISAYPNFSVAPFARLWVDPCTNESDRASSQKIRKAVQPDRLLLAMLVWFPVPATLLGFWLSFLAAHDSMGSLIQGVAFVVSVLVSILAYAEMVTLLTLGMPWQNKSLLFSRYRSGRARKQKRDRKAPVVQDSARPLLGELRSGEADDGKPKLRLVSIAVVAVLIGLGMRHVAQQVFNNEVMFNCRNSEDRFREQRTRCYWFAADLAHADVSSLVLHGANLRRAFMQQAQLAETDLEDAYFDGALLSGATAQGVTLRDISGRHTIFWEANLDGAIIKEADLRDADLRGASLRGARLQGAELYRANLVGADLTGAVLCGAVIDSAGRDSTTFSPGQLRSAYGVERIQNWKEDPLDTAGVWKSEYFEEGPFYLDPREHLEYQSWREAQFQLDTVLLLVEKHYSEGHRTLPAAWLASALRRVDLSMGAGTQRLQDSVVQQLQPNGPATTGVVGIAVQPLLDTLISRVRKKALNHCVLPSGVRLLGEYADSVRKAQRARSSSSAVGRPR